MKNVFQVFSFVKFLDVFKMFFQVNHIFASLLHISTQRTVFTSGIIFLVVRSKKLDRILKYNYYNLHLRNGLTFWNCRHKSLTSASGDGGDDLGVLEEDAGGDRAGDDVQRSQSVRTLKLSQLLTTNVRLLKPTIVFSVCSYLVLM